MITVLALESCCAILFFARKRIFSEAKPGRLRKCLMAKPTTPSHIHHPLLSTSMLSNAVQLKLDDDVLHHIATFIPPDTLAKLSSVSPVFFREHMKDVYTSLSFIKRDRQMKKLLLHLG